MVDGSLGGSLHFRRESCGTSVIFGVIWGMNADARVRPTESAENLIYESSNYRQTVQSKRSQPRIDEASKMIEMSARNDSSPSNS